MLWILLVRFQAYPSLNVISESLAFPLVQISAMKYSELTNPEDVPLKTLWF